MKEPNLSGKRIILFTVIILLLGCLLIGGYFFYRRGGFNFRKENPQERVAGLIELDGAMPQKITTVTDVSDLRNNIFFKRAQNGDVLLIYPSARKAILYRPSTNKLIEVAAYNPSSDSQVPSQAPKNIKVAIYNGTKTAGLAKSQGSLLTSKHPNIQITSTANAVSDYTKDLIVDLTGKNAEFAKTLANELNGEVGKLPSVEAEPDADILIILGAAQ